MSDLRVRRLTVEYRSAAEVLRPLEGFDLDAAHGSLLVVMGPSGSGKTTLLACLGGILTPASGTIRVGDREVTAMERRQLVAYRRSTVGIVFQAFNLIAGLTALENVMAPLLAAGRRRRPAAERAAGLLAEVGLSDRAGHRPGALSGGEQQRVAIARALAADPPLLLADEPTAHLDRAQVDGILALLRAAVGPGRLAVVATHDERVAAVADRVVELAAGAPPP
ncbi:MAG TPA: ABC transporter ATP-binding protein [Acidimicrobiales bacterium]|nr:ABC transporter ATP-binding protein [Acidimicrobiales bacterium]